MAVVASTESSVRPAVQPRAIVFAGLVALAVAMGIGRFSLTPQLPHLISEGQIDLTGAGLIAAANYLGYLIGALDAMRARRPDQVRNRLHTGLWLCVGLTLASYWAQGFWAHLLLRFGSGIASVPPSVFFVIEEKSRTVFRS